MKTRDELDEMLALEVLTDPAVRDGLTDRQLQVMNAWLKDYNDRRGVPPFPRGTTGR